MNKVPKECRYTSTHEWVRFEDDGSVTIGITDYAQSHLGELVFVGLPEPEILVHASDEVCTLESLKTTSDVYSPLSGTILAVNEDLEEAPSLVNSDPYGDGWLFRLEPSDAEECSELLEPDAYLDSLEEDED